MDSLSTAVARALTAWDPIGALNRVALREDASALALRGMAMAQLGHLDLANSLLAAREQGVPGGFNSNDIASRFVAWWRPSKHSCTGICP